MPRLTLTSGELSGHLVVGAEQRIHAMLPKDDIRGRRIVLESISIRYRLEGEPLRTARDLIPNIDPIRGYESEHIELAAPNGEGAHPNDDATGHSHEGSVEV